MTPSPAAIAIRWAASAQALAVVAIHGIWMLFAAHTWTQAYPSEHVLGVVVDKAMAVFVWLGGMGPDGRHGNVDSLLAVWFKLSLPFYLLAELWRWKRGPRPPTRWWVLVLASSAGSLAGYAFALWPTLPTLGNAQDAPWLLAMMTIAAAVMTGWAIVAHRLGEWTIGLIESRRDAAAVGVLPAGTEPSPQPVKVVDAFEGLQTSPGGAAAAGMARSASYAALPPAPRQGGAKLIFLALALLAALTVAYVGSIVLLWVMALSG